MEGRTAAEALRQRRLEVAMTQRELAARSGVPQPNIAAYETGRRRPSAETLARLHEVLLVPSIERLRLLRDPILQLAEARRLEDVRVFGSVARGESTHGSDVDLLVHPRADASVFDLAGFMAEASELLSVPVDVVSDRGTGPTMDRIRAEAIAL